VKEVEEEKQERASPGTGRKHQVEISEHQAVLRKKINPSYRGHENEGRSPGKVENINHQACF